MKIDLYAISICENDGQPTQIAGGGLIMIFEDIYNRMSSRSASYGFGNSTQNLADLQIVKLALSSVRSAYRNFNIILHTNSNYINEMLEYNNGSFVATPSKYTFAITEMRRWFSYYGNITIICENDGFNNEMTQANNHAKIALSTQEHSDSGTIIDK